MNTQRLKQENAHGVLGEVISYPKTYSPESLFPIARSLGRDEIVSKTNVTADIVSIGIDWWHCFELSWLNPMGISQVAMVRLAIPADSKSIIESKSLKLYLNSLNFTEFDSVDSVKQTIENDLSKALETNVLAVIFSLDNDEVQSNSLSIVVPEGKNIDKALDDNNKKIAIIDEISAEMLQIESHGEQLISQCYHSNLLRSNCPVTNQPDWGTVQIDIDSAKLDEASLLEYLLTYRQHNGFHEQCVEQIFADLTKVFKPTKLMVRAWYTRRGGIDINPCRVSDMRLLPEPSRLVRQ